LYPSHVSPALAAGAETIRSAVKDVLMKKALLLIAMGAGGVLFMQKRKREAAAEAALWDEATKAAPVAAPKVDPAAPKADTPTTPAEAPTTTAGPAV
jgi:hypothetical protein